MPFEYADKSRESDLHAIPNVEVFYMDEEDIEKAGVDAFDAFKDGGKGWYWWFCMPGYLPEGEPVGPFDTEKEALRDMRDECDE